MNKRINELMEQSVETRIDIFSNEEYNAFSREKFAELIVKECVDIANKNRTAMEMDRNTHLTADAIKEHFGIEE